MYGSKHAQENRRKVKSWMLKAKAEALEALESAQEMSQEEYEQLIEGIAATYSAVQDASRGDIAAFKKEMKEGPRDWGDRPPRASGGSLAWRRRVGAPWRAGSRS